MLKSEVHPSGMTFATVCGACGRMCRSWAGRLARPILGRVELQVVAGGTTKRPNRDSVLVRCPGPCPKRFPRFSLVPAADKTGRIAEVRNESFNHLPLALRTIIRWSFHMISTLCLKRLVHFGRERRHGY